ncbi:protein SCO1/2 [Nitrosomonas cryotolerans]|uniref:Protein SCO1/2 n=1 Tax=Nitrosomonas cryotolerans ATCC 49181 TaxID=1131553 RepID=A0A1N6IXR1_9PROT|nr:SCO family protein [Nitrosomonas cryotolerans]SFP85914.1 protein SCO1/2 [Nitrosomonas cryotolerans]SIO36686.1 protein SCO1/2 [Nitrosomonas cryotolerans ATCC 49181]
MKRSLLRNRHILTVIMILLLFTQTHASALTLVLTQPVILEKESLGYLRQAHANDSESWQLIVFGFTHCKDVCPLSLANFSLLMAAGAAKQIKLKGIFVTVDPDRDSDAALTSYTENFGTDIAHLRLEDETLERFKSAFGVEANFYTKNTGNMKNYQVDHSSTAFLVDPEGKIRILFDALEDADDIAKMLHENPAFFRS